jgi:uncharacterized protein (DUF2062 family)
MTSIVFSQPVVHDVNHDLVTNELTSLNNHFCLPTKVGACLDSLSKYLSSRYMRNTATLSQTTRLRTFTGTGRPQHDEIQRH